MTSLAQQLQRLALPQTDSSLLSRREVASLLFDPNVALLDLEEALRPKEGAHLDESMVIYFLGAQAKCFFPSSQSLLTLKMKRGRWKTLS